MTTKEAAKLWGVSRETATEYCTQGIVPGAVKDKNDRWQIPDGTPKPMSKDKLAKLLQYADQDGWDQFSKTFSLAPEQTRQVLCYFENMNLVYSKEGNAYLTNAGKILVDQQNAKKRKVNWKQMLSFTTELVKLVQAVLPILTNLL